MNYLIILNDSPYGTERSYNGLRVANSVAKDEETSVSVFLMGDAASGAVAGQTTPNGYYNIERMLKALAAKGGKVAVCGSCMDARGLKPEALAQGVHRSSMDELTCWTKEADKVIVFGLAVSYVENRSLPGQPLSLERQAIAGHGTVLRTTGSSPDHHRAAGSAGCGREFGLFICWGLRRGEATI